MDKHKSIIEPFPLFGVESIIYSRDQALKVLKSNSYYIFVAGFMTLFIYLASKFFNLNIGKSETYLLCFIIVFFTIGFLIRWCQSRVASIISLLLFSYTFITKFAVEGFGGSFMFTLIFVAASYRSIKASFYYHKSTD